VEEINDDEVVFRNYEGKRFTYKQPRQTTIADREAEPDIVPIRRGKKKEKERVARTKRRKASGE
jgi:hypothetical protein